MATTKSLLLYLTATLFLVANVRAGSNTRFQQFWPYYRDYFVHIRDTKCADLYATQQTLSGSDASMRTLKDSDPTRSPNCNMLLDCILENTRESMKLNMATGTVALGIMPAILVFLGSSTAETSLLSKRRPLLALLVACGSPAVNPIQMFDYQNPVVDLKTREGRRLPGHLLNLSRLQSAAVVLAEYILVAGVIVNVITASFHAGSWTTNAISCDTYYYPLLWAVLTSCVHIIGGIWAIYLRAETIRDPQAKRGLAIKLTEWLRHEFSPCITHNKLVLKWNDETYLYIFVSWFACVATSAHVIFGVVAFSSLIFIGYVDSLKIIGRFIASAVVCRSVLMFELAGMRNAILKNEEVISNGNGKK
ncbi:uncharacterized protein BP5553_02484 [Venustampulla echinocandica]|uniref:Uncharacterized protein n=1 Tax=Venustampulla echinocandica TaxID=2656787 RepID=A0A370U406_9HELO|nr:uncharacterized protein BP5553_02484 [Venustampulla echinocandica]RDL42505.1 hypothetical protein BP5553_02484 [Venustampulla echinocandica]